MKSISVKEMTTPLSDYATVTEDASLHDAVAELEKTQQKFKDHLYPHNSVIVVDNNNKVIGRITQLEALKALEPKYFEMGDITALSRFGLSHSYLTSMIGVHKLFEKPLDHVCRKASSIKVKSFITPFSKNDFIDENATLNEAIHQFVVGGHYCPSILVKRGEKVTGVLRLTDIFHEISKKIQSCAI